MEGMDVLGKVGEVVLVLREAENVDEVICALHSIAALLFPLDSSTLSGSINQRYKDKVTNEKVLSEKEMSDWWQAFYRGAGFPTLAHALLHNVASDWLVCFPFSARKLVYDVFFIDGLATEVIQAIVPSLQSNGSDDAKNRLVRTNAERLLVLTLIENDHVLRMAKEFGESFHFEVTNKQLKPAIAMVAQLVAAIPDKSESRGPNSLSSHSFFKQITIQLLSIAESDMNMFGTTVLGHNNMNGPILFVGETFSRICRRGSADVLLGELGPHILRHVRSLLQSNFNSINRDVIESVPSLQFWLKLIEAVKDLYAIERILEQLLHQLVVEHTNDIEAYWILWVLFNRGFKQQASVKSLFVDKFLLWKIFPLSCLKWILQFSVLQCPPNGNSLKKESTSSNLLDAVQHLVTVWSKRGFVQSAAVEQQAYLTAALGLCLEVMSKEELDMIKDALHFILEGVSCRLESPDHLTRKMASSIALAFSKVIDPKNPLYLDDSIMGDAVDWDFGLTTPACAEKRIDRTNTCNTLVHAEQLNNTASNGIGNNVKDRRKKTEFNLMDPDEVIDPVSLANESVSDEGNDGNASESFDSSSEDSDLQPYDLSDDDSDLKRKFSQLVDVVGALRKSDDADGVESALDVAEKLVRASPDELRHMAGELARTLVHVRCSNLAVEGEEDLAEEKRQKALVALVATCPLESLETLNKLLYSPNMDTGQRILILDIMTDAACELANAKFMRPKHHPKTLISIISDAQPWFLPINKGPPGAGPWREISEAGTVLKWSHSCERELPPKPGQVRRGTTRRWSLRSVAMPENGTELSQNKFPVYAAAFMLPAMQGFDKKRHGVDLLGRDFIVLGKLIYLLGVCMKCAAMHPEAFAIAPALLDMLSSRGVCQHAEPYVRRSALFATSCVLAALHPSYVASTLIEGNPEFTRGLEWARTWALQVTEADTDRECYMMAMTCLKLHAEMALQASRALEAEESTLKTRNACWPWASTLSKGTIRIPYSNTSL